MLFATTIVTALVLAGIEAYPFRSRLLLYLLPLIALVLAVAVDVIAPQRPRLAAAVALGLVAVVLVSSAQVFVDPHDRFDIEPALAIVRDGIRDGDVIVLGPGSSPAFDFYRDEYGLGDVGVVPSPDHDVDSVLLRAEGARAWFVASHPVGSGGQEAQAMVERPEVAFSWDGDSVHVRLVEPT